MQDTIILSLEHVSKSFAKIEHDTVTHALDDINLSLKKGEFVSLLGPSGCGKSTILRLVAGLIPPTQGQVMAEGKKIEKQGPDRGMVFQAPTLFPWLTVEDNVAFSLKLKNDFKAGDTRVAKMIKMIGLENFKDDYPGQLSGGMAQRVALVRALIAEPNILLLDEPLGALDAFTRMNMQDEILKIWQERKQLILMVTHDVDEAIYMSTRVIVMTPNPGKIRDDINIELPYPRERASDEFIEYRKKILNELHLGGKHE
ncbi:MAG: ABC transporter ATP-binding protein [Treponemataceae bacterium]